MAELGPVKPSAVSAHALLTFETAEQAQSAQGVLEAASLERGPLVATLIPRLPPAEKLEKRAAKESRRRERHKVEEAASVARRAVGFPPSRSLYVGRIGDMSDSRLMRTEPR